MHGTINIKLHNYSKVYKMASKLLVADSTFLCISHLVYMSHSVI